MFKCSGYKNVTHVAGSIRKDQISGFQQAKNLLLLSIGKDDNVRCRVFEAADFLKQERSYGVQRFVLLSCVFSCEFFGVGIL